MAIEQPYTADMYQAAASMGDQSAHDPDAIMRAATPPSLRIHTIHPQTATSFDRPTANNEQRAHLDLGNVTSTFSPATPTTTTTTTTTIGSGSPLSRFTSSMARKFSRRDKKHGSSTSSFGSTIVKSEKEDVVDDGAVGAGAIGFRGADIREDSLQEGEMRDVFERSDGEGVNYRTMRWWHVGMLMIAETVSLGILALPSAVAAVGFIPGICLLIFFGLIATYAGYVIGQFKLRHPQVYNMADAGALLFAGMFGGGPISKSATFGRRLFGGAFVLFLVFCMAAHILAFSIMMNVLTNHGACTILWTVIGTILCGVLALPRTLKKVSYLSIASFISITSAVFIVMAGVGVNHKERAKDWQAAVERVKFTNVMLAMMNIVMAYSGNVAFFGFISELQDPKQYTKALVLLQSTATMLYVVVASVIYYFCGGDVPSPALSAAGPLIRKIAYGVALPTIVVAGVVNGHVALKYLFMVFKGDLLTEKSARATSWWVLLNAILWCGAWILAESIPVFNQLIGVVSALLGSWFTYGISGGLWLYLNHGCYFASSKKILLFIANIGMLTLGIALCGMGTYASIFSVVTESANKVWSCADNSAL